MARTQRLSYNTSHHSRGGEGSLFPGEGLSSGSAQRRREHRACREFPFVSFLYPLSLVLQLLLFSYLITVFSKLFLSQPMILNFGASNSPLQSSTGKDGGGASGLMVWRVSVGALNQGIPFLNNQESAERKQIKLINFVIFQVLRK